jgi:hypothetical protein
MPLGREIVRPCPPRRIKPGPLPKLLAHFEQRRGAPLSVWSRRTCVLRVRTLRV